MLRSFGPCWSLLQGLQGPRKRPVGPATRALGLQQTVGPGSSVAEKKTHSIVQNMSLGALVWLLGPSQAHLPPRSRAHEQRNPCKENCKESRGLQHRNTATMHFSAEKLSHVVSGPGRAKVYGTDEAYQTDVAVLE